MEMFMNVPKVWENPTIDHFRKPSSGPFLETSQKGKYGKTYALWPNMDGFRSWLQKSSFVHDQRCGSIATPIWMIWVVQNSPFRKEYSLAMGEASSPSAAVERQVCGSYSGNPDMLDCNEEKLSAS